MKGTLTRGIHKNKPFNQKFKEDPEKERQFEELRRKYAFAIAYLLVKNIGPSNIKPYFDLDENKQRYESIKKFRADILEYRPRSKQWVDKSFYLGIKIQDVQTKEELTEDGPITEATLVVGGCIFKQKTSVVASPKELDIYIDTIGRIIESEKIWNDPMMAEFDFGDEELYKQKKRRASRKSNSPTTEECEGYQGSQEKELE